MKKTKFKNLKLFAFLLLLTFLSCADDELHETSNSNAGIKSSKIKCNDFIKHTAAFNIVTDVNNNQNAKNKNLNRSVTDTLNNFTIDTAEGIYLQYANLHSFTFPIHREIDNGKLENLVLSYQNDGSYKVKILKYDLTAQEKIDLENDQLKTIQNPIITIPLESFNTNLVVNSCGEYTETIYVSCSSGNHSFATGTAFDCSFWSDVSSGIPPRVYSVTKYKCIDAGPSSGGGGSEPLDGGFGSNPTPGGGGSPTYNTYPTEYPTPETNPLDYEEGISAPVKPFLNAPDKTPCTDLNTKSVNSAFKQKMQELSADANGVAEAGLVTYKDSPNYGNKTYGGLDSNGNSYCALDLDNTRASQTTGFIHCHLNTTNPILKTLTVFSLTDFVAYATLVENSTADVSELGIFVTTDRGAFALKLTDKQAIIDLSNYIVNNEREALDDFQKNVKYGDSKNKQIKGLLNFLKEKAGTEIELYEVDSAFETWKKKSLDVNGNIQTTDC